MPQNKIGTITLPEDIFWTDEFDWSPVGQKVEPTLSGGMVIQESAMLAGRPITLESLSETIGWADRATVLLLKALADQPAQQHTLELYDGSTYDVVFRRDSGEGFEAKPLIYLAPFEDTDRYLITLRLMTV